MGIKQVINDCKEVNMMANERLARLTENSPEEYQTYYFTFGTGETMPFRGGWVEVIAESRSVARETMGQLFGTNGGYLRFAFDYSEEELKSSCMWEEGNLGQRSHMTIVAEKDPYGYIDMAILPPITETLTKEKGREL